MKLFYFELKVGDRLVDTKVVTGHTSWDAWVKFHEMLAGTWETEMEEHRIEDWRQVAYCAVIGTTYAAHNTCPATILNPKS